MTSIAEMVKHYQRSIDKSMDNQARLLHCIEKLHKLPITVEHLQETGIGRTVNGLRKYDGEVGYAAKALVTKWKQMVAAEEPEDDTGEQQQTQTMDTEPNEVDDEEDDDDDNAESRLEIDETENIEPEPVEVNEQLSSDEKIHDRHHENDKKHKDRENHSSKHRGHSDKHRSDDRHRKERSSHNKDVDTKKSHSHTRDKDKVRDKPSEYSSHHSSGDKHKEKKHSSSSSSRHHHESSSTHRTTDSSSSSKREKREKVKEHVSPQEPKRESSKHDSEGEKRSGSKSGEESSSSKRRRHDEKSSSQKESSSSRHRKEEDRPAKKRSKQNDIDDMTIDSSMGASFADALGMLDHPNPVKKKSSSRSTASKTATNSKSSETKSSSTQKSPSSSTSKLRDVSPTASSSYAIAEPKAPLLLTKRPKLEPLPDIASEISTSVPIISNNYKPLPLNPTIMDCVYTQSNQPKQRIMTDEEAFGYSIMSKKERTKMYSGTKTGYRGEVPRLFDLCIRVLQENLDDLEFTGGIPYEILKPILERATMQQLLVIEHYNPYLVEDTDELWQIHCKRHFRGRQPEELESWREMFLRLQDEQQAKLEKLTKNIKAAQEKSVPVKKTKLAYVDNYIKPPRNVLKKQERYGTNSLVSASPATRVAALDGHVGVKLAKPGDVKLRMANAIRDAVPVQPARVNPNRKAPLMQKTLMSIKKLKQR